MKKTIGLIFGLTIISLFLLDISFAKNSVIKNLIAKNLYVTGVIKNTNKNKPVTIKDNLKVTGKIIGKINSKNLSKGSITGDKISSKTITAKNIDFTTDGVVKGGADILFTKQTADINNPICNTPEIKKWFNNVNDQEIKVVRSEIDSSNNNRCYHEFDLGFDVSNRYIGAPVPIVDNFGQSYSFSGKTLIRLPELIGNNNYLGILIGEWVDNASSSYAHIMLMVY